jgi:predicted HicB family RNase H-like nuclease
MYNYQIIVYPVETESGTEWIARYPEVNNTGGSGATIEAAIADAKNNLKFELDLLAEEGKTPPKPYETPNYSGKISLRIPRSVHKQIAELSESEGVSINSLISAAVSGFIGQVRDAQK